MEQSTTLPVASSSTPTSQNYTSPTPTSHNDNVSTLNDIVNQHTHSPPSPPHHHPHEQTVIDNNNRLETLENKFNQVLDLLSQLTSSSSSFSSQSQSSSSSSAKRESTPHPITGQTTNLKASPSIPPLSPPVQYASSSSSYSSRLYNGLVKFNPPQFFTAKPEGDQQLALLNFVSAMNRYLVAVQIDPDSYESLNVAAMRLSDFASQWYDFTMERDPHLLTSWNTLKEQMKKRYQPIAQGQLAFASLLKVRYTNSIEKLNHEFLKYLQLLPEYNNGQSENVMIGIYMNALTESSGTTYICTTLRNAIAQEDVTTLSQVQSMALLAESNLGKSGRSSVPFVPSSNRHSASSSSSSYRFNSNNKFRPSSSSSFKSNYNRPSVPAPSFSTPAKLHNVQFDEADPDNEDITDPNQADRNYENDLSGDPISTPSFHADNNNFGESVSEDDLAFLNAMRFHENAKQHHPTLSTDEIDRRRRNNTCFKCNQSGHYANKCPSGSSSTNQSKKF